MTIGNRNGTDMFGNKKKKTPVPDPSLEAELDTGIRTMQDDLDELSGKTPAAVSVPQKTTASATTGSSGSPFLPGNAVVTESGPIQSPRKKSFGFFFGKKEKIRDRDGVIIFEEPDRKDIAAHDIAEEVGPSAGDGILYPYSVTPRKNHEKRLPKRHETIPTEKPATVQKTPPSRTIRSVPPAVPFPIADKTPEQIGKVSSYARIDDIGNQEKIHEKSGPFGRTVPEKGNAIRMASKSTRPGSPAKPERATLPSGQSMLTATRGTTPSVAVLQTSNVSLDKKAPSGSVIVSGNDIDLRITASEHPSPAVPSETPDTPSEKSQGLDAGKTRYGTGKVAMRQETRENGSLLGKEPTEKVPSHAPQSMESAKIRFGDSRAERDPLEKRGRELNGSFEAKDPENIAKITERIEKSLESAFEKDAKRLRSEVEHLFKEHSGEQEKTADRLERRIEQNLKKLEEIETEEKELVNEQEKMARSKRRKRDSKPASIEIPTGRRNGR